MWASKTPSKILDDFLRKLRLIWVEVCECRDIYLSENLTANWCRAASGFARIIGNRIGGDTEFARIRIFKINAENSLITEFWTWKQGQSSGIENKQITTKTVLYILLQQDVAACCFIQKLLTAFLLQHTRKNNLLKNSENNKVHFKTRAQLGKASHITSEMLKVH